MSKHIQDILKLIKTLNDRDREYPCDLKEPNVYLDENRKIRCTDLRGSWSEDTDKDLLRFYTAPEMTKVKEGSYSRREKKLQDAWALGVTVMNLYLGEACKPIILSHSDRQKRRDIQENLDLIREKYKDDQGEIIVQILYGLLQPDPELRTDLQEASQLFKKYFPTL